MKYVKESRAYREWIGLSKEWKMKSLCFTLVGLILLSACSSSATNYPQPSETIPVATATETLMPAPRQEPTLFPTNQLSQKPTQTLSPTSRPTHLPGPVIHEYPGPIYDTVVQIPVGEGAIQYRGAGVEDMEPVGPNGLVITPDGVFIIGDVSGNRLLRYDAAGNRLSDIDLTSLGILNISDLVGSGDALYILEISFKVLPERYRVNQLTTDGELVWQYELPRGFHLENGLYGLAIGFPGEGEPEVLVELRPSGSHYYRLPDKPDSKPEAIPALPVYGKDLRQESAEPGELAVLAIGEQEFKSLMTAGGMLSLLAARADGSLYLQREDLVSWIPVITTDITIHFISPEGRQIGLARYPMMDWYFHLWRFLTVGPDGNVYALITREKSVDVLRLNFYAGLEPILSGAAEPIITVPPTTPSHETSYDCSLINHHAPDSPEAQSILGEFLNNFHKDYPTEYMEFEQVWAVDSLEEYTAIQGSVTQEEKDIIVVQQTERGYVMVTRYTSDMILEGLGHADIPEYLAAQLPDAPAELFYCMDLSRFIGKIK